MSTIVLILDAIAPQFINDPNKDLFIELSQGQTSSTCFGTQYNHAVALRAAHMLTLSSPDRAGVAGSITSKKEGDVSISFASPNTQNIDDLSQTSYGQQLKAMQRALGLNISVTGPNLFCCG